MNQPDRIDPLPDTFTKPDGSRLSSPDQWPEQRQHLISLIAVHQYGVLPPAPPEVVLELLHQHDYADPGPFSDLPKNWQPHP